ncbi:glycosyltransferase [Clostridium sp. AL.422]|uniref:glycosyltransferase n=1 Tax=Clostridium TaxID=1485 RepID=UPI00293DAAAA|nr:MULTISPECIES: glycosyltransferase [unclassified Clostridium]MDV4149715.1 glycosyltransferase [Clostridium sp. AL.422]
MNNKKICFITCVMDLETYSENLLYINNLIVPEGYQIETINIREVDSIAKAYNEAMKLSDARYKVYLQENIFIINNTFIKDIIEVFESNEKIGLIGMIGTKILSKDFDLYKSNDIYGKIYTNKSGIMDLEEFQRVENAYEEVQLIDGILMATQYDVTWREDIFDGFEYYDLSQSVEFLKKQYKVVVLNQSKPWCIEDIEKKSYLKKEIYKERFIEEYINFLYPLVSILIPTYNQTVYLKEALESAINQTYPNIEIIIGDDSTTDEVRNFLEPYLHEHNNISYFKNERDYMDYGYKNVNELLNRSKGEYINYLNHDDIFHPQKIERMMRFFLENPNLTLVTSLRQPIDEMGNELRLNGAFRQLFKHNRLISGREISKYAITNTINCIGEPTTALFKKKYISKNRYGYLNNERIKGVSDLANWINILQYGDLVYIPDTLSYFRFNSNQNSNNISVMMMSIIGWFKLIKNSYEIGIINYKEYKLALNKCCTIAIGVMNTYIYSDNKVDNNINEEIMTVYKNAIDIMLSEATNKECKCPVCNNEIERFLPYQYKKHELDEISKYNTIGSDVENFLCPECYCHDRERHLIKYFDKLKIWDKYIRGKRVLHIAPEDNIYKIIHNLDTKEYVCGDLYPKNNSIINIDITNMQFENNYFDFIICNHVLEHIHDDLIAMKELKRVLRNGGYVVLQTPYSNEIHKSFEDEKINTPEMRKKYYGQSNHVRIYGTDLFERLENAGFSLEIIKNDDLFTREECKKYGFNYREDLILVRK